MNSKHILTALLAGTSTLALSTTVIAQTNAAAAPVVQEVVVTGSRVIQNGNNSPTPLTVVSADTLLTTQPTTISDGLTQLPQFIG